MQISVFNKLLYLENLVNQENQGSDNCVSDLSSGNYNIQFISAKQGHYTVKITKK